MVPFDPNQLIPLIGMIGGMLLSAVVLWAFFKSDLASAIAERIRSGMHRRGRGRHAFADTPMESVESDHVAELEQRVSDLQGQIAEMAERLDFAERLLAKKAERSLPGA
jgi:TolA-binding protein